MRLLTLFSALLLVPGLAPAEVNPKNGNFVISYEDIEQRSGGYELNLRRTYNSKTPRPGWFGWGWGSRFETYAMEMPDGSAVVHENGSGRISYYDGEQPSATSQGLEKILAAMAVAEQHDTAGTAALRERLRGNEELRVRMVRQHGIRTDSTTGSTWLSRDCLQGKLVRIVGGYERTACDGSTDFFAAQGHMIAHEDGDYRIDVHYDGSRVTSIDDSQGQSLQLEWTPDGQVSSARNKGGRRVNYSYNERGELVSIGEGYHYEYDDLHRMTAIRYIDTTSHLMAYGEDGMIRSSINRYEEETRYAYGSDPADPDRYWTTVTEITPAGRSIAKTYEYRVASSDRGVDHVLESAVVAGDVRKETAYDDKGRVIRRVGADGSMEQLVYHPRTGKLILVLGKERRVAYYYNCCGELVRVEDSSGQTVDLMYGERGLIREMVEVNDTDSIRRVLRFRYNDARKPVEIHLLGIGKIAVEYDDKGEISKVDSNGGVKIALHVTQAFQTLLRLVENAGASL